MLVGYARVSTQDQKLELQRNALKEVQSERVFEGKASGAKAARPGLTNPRVHAPRRHPRHLETCSSSGSTFSKSASQTSLSSRFG